MLSHFTDQKFTFSAWKESQFSFEPGFEDNTITAISFKDRIRSSVQPLLKPVSQQTFLNFMPSSDRKKDSQICFHCCLICSSADTHRLGRVGSPAGRAVARPAGGPKLLLLLIFLLLFIFSLLHHLLFLHVLLVCKQGEWAESEEDAEGLQLHQGSRQRQLRQGAVPAFICCLLTQKFLLMRCSELFFVHESDGNVRDSRRRDMLIFYCTNYFTKTSATTAF